MNKDRNVIYIVYIICMLALISDYKVLANIVGAITTIIMLFYIALNKKKQQEPLERKTRMHVLFFLFYFTVTSFIHFNIQAWGTTMLIYLMVFTPFLLFNFIFNNEGKKLMSFIVFSFFVIWNVFLYLCYKTCLETPDLARMMTSDRAFFYEIVNGGGYYMGYGSAILITYLYSRLISGNFKNVSTKIFVLFEIFFMVATIWVIKSYVILLSMITGLIVATINRIARTQRTKIISYVFSSIVFLFIYFNINSISVFLLDNTGDEFWHKRIEETFDSAVRGDSSDHLDERERVYQISIDGFMQSPIFGNGYKNGNIFAKNESNNIGNHSTILDSLAQFGILGSIPLFFLLLYPLRRAIARGEYWEYNVPFFIMSFLNPVLKCYHVMVILFMIIPLMEQIKIESKYIPIKVKKY